MGIITMKRPLINKAKIGFVKTLKLLLRRFVEFSTFSLHDI